MAVIISNGNTNLSAASGFYRVEAHNLGAFSSTALALSTTRTIGVTFANAGNCQGLVIGLAATGAVTRDVTVKLQENVASVWTDRASVTLTAAQISNGVANQQGTWFIPFSFGTPYAVDTTSNKWRFEVSQGGSGNNWSLTTSDGTNPFYATWCANAVTFSSGNDTVICKDVVTIDMTATFKAVAVTGDATRGICCVVCRSSSAPKSSNTVANFIWQNPPSSAYTLTIDGIVVMGSHSAVRIGDSTNRISFTNKAKIVYQTPSIGTTCAFVTAGGTFGSGTGHKSSFFFYGAIPTRPYTTLASQANTGQANITTVDTTGWVIGGRIYVGKQNVVGAGDTTDRTISSIVGTAITLSSNLATANRLIGGVVVNFDQYGVWFLGVSGQAYGIQPGFPSNFIASGCLIERATIASSTSANFYHTDDSANVDSGGIQTVDSAFLFASSGWTGRTNISPEGWTLQRCVSWLSGQCLTPTAYNALVPTLTFSDNIILGGINSVNPTTGGAGFKAIIQNNRFESAANAFIFYTGFGSVITGNAIWGSSGGGSNAGAVVQSLFNPISIGSNTYDKSNLAFYINGVAVGAIESNSSFGQTQVNVADIEWAPGIYYDYEFSNVVGTLILTTTNQKLTANGTRLKFSRYNTNTNDHRVYGTYGNFQSTGAGLSDTTVRTSGADKFALRAAPNDPTNLLKWFETVPTGDIQNKTMTVSVWVYINNAAYASGVHTKPQLVIDYDNGTLVTATALASYGAWQQLAVTFTPLTTYGQITVTIQGATAATGSNAYFYNDDINIAYPAGVQINLGGLDLWANALPVTPTIATFPSLGGVWDEVLNAHDVSGSFGEFVQKLLTVAKFIVLK